MTVAAAYTIPMMKLYILTLGLHPRRVTIYLKNEGNYEQV
jgi:hypothetical protein